MKILIITDLEGPSGINGRSDGIGNKTINLPVACQVLMDEVNACVRGLLKGGADEIVVWDGHGGSNSLDITDLLPPAQLYTYGDLLTPCTLVDASYDAMVMIGYHAMSGVADGYMNHSYNSHQICNIWFNGELIGEIGVCAYKAAYFGVPSIMLSGDQAACREVKALIPNIHTVCTKHSQARYSTINRNPKDVQKDIEEMAEIALRDLPNMKPLQLPKHIEYKIQLMCPNNADGYEKIGWERVDPHTVKTEGDDFIDVYSLQAGWAPGTHKRRFGITPQWKGTV